MMAQAFDRYLPSQFGYVSPKYGSPVFAHAFDLAVTLVLIGLAAFLYGTISSLYGAVMASMIYFAFVGAAAVIYAIRKERGASKAVLATAGILQLCVFSYLTYEFLLYPRIWGGNILAYGYIALSFVVGVLVYVYAKVRRKKEGFDIALAFKEIPPE
jgi:amino acid transporter